MLFPIIPQSASIVLSFFELDIKNIKFDLLNEIALKKIKVINPRPIFPRIE